MQKYVYILLKNYIQMMVYVVKEGSEELSESVLIPFAPTRISANIDGEKRKEITSVSVLSNNVNQINVFRYGTLKGEQVENMFFRSETPVTFDEMMHDLATYTGYTTKTENPAYSQWGGLSGNISDQKDLVGMMATKNDAPLNIKLSNEYIEFRELGLKEYLLKVDFSHLNFDNGNQYVLLVDRFKSRERKGWKDVIVVDPNSGEKYKQRTYTYRDARFYHESPLDAENNGRRSEIPIEKNAVINMELNAHTYFGNFGMVMGDVKAEVMGDVKAEVKGRIRKFPMARGLKNYASYGGKQTMVTMQFRLRTVDRFGNVISESGPIGKVNILANIDTRVVSYRIN